MPFISKGARQFPTNSFYWRQLFVYRLILLAAIPLLGAPLYAAVSRSSTIEEVLSPISPLLFWGWLLLFSGLVALIVDAVGIVDELPTIEQQLPNNSEQLEAEAWGLLSKARTTGQWLTPPALVRAMESRITEQQATAFTSAWYRATHTRPGVKPKEEQEFVESLNGHGG